MSVETGSEVLETLSAPAYTASVTVGIKAVSPNKAFKENNFARSRRVKAARQGVHWALKQIGKPAFPCVVLMTRIAPSTNGLDAHDNLQGSMKPHVDGVADWLGIRDDDKRVTWRYGQERGTDYAVRITVQADA
ncbi:MAG: hypothetical protein PHD99_04725 [Candidatus Moranbacteria bacterium]|nr:hypothetical protein [Candidatus Moranbacteria bacterium]